MSEQQSSAVSVDEDFGELLTLIDEFDARNSDWGFRRGVIEGVINRLMWRVGPTLNAPQTASVPALHALQRGNYEDRYPTDDILWSASDHKDFIEVVEVLGLQESHQTPADAVRELQAEIDRLRNEPQTAPSDIERAFRDACDEAGCAYDNEALLEAIQALKERCQAEIVPVPKAALDWLFGEGVGPDGKWFCDDQDTEQRTPRKYSRAYWWRSKFRSMIPALTRPKCGDGQ